MKTTEEIYAELKNAFESSSGLELNDGGDMALRFRALAAQLGSLHCEADYVTVQGMPQTASGENLDYYAQLKGLERTPAVKASGTITFYGLVGASATVEKGTRCLGNNGVEYVTTEKKSFTAGQMSCEVAAEATVAGSVGNIAIGGVETMTLPPVGVIDCQNTVAFTGGRDAESDEELRKRVLSSYKSVINGGNKEYYRQLAATVNGIAAAQVIPQKRGVGTVDVVVASARGVPTAAQIAEVQALMDENREVCTDVLVKSPQTVSVPVTATVTAKSGYDQKSLCSKVKAALSKYFTGELLGVAVRRAELERIISAVAGVESCTLSLPTQDVALDADELPVAGAISVSGGTA